MICVVNCVEWTLEVCSLIMIIIMIVIIIIIIVTHDPRSTMFLSQRLSVVVQRGNAWCELGTFTNN